jgi:aminoglycoside phosphotransferase (APT) family kinase protein
VFKPFLDAIRQLNIVPASAQCDLNLRSTKKHIVLEVMVDRVPTAVVKYPRDPRETFLLNEIDILEALSGQAQPSAQVRVPAVLGRGEASDRPFLLQSFLPGFGRLRVEDDEDLARTLVDWLADLGRRTTASGNLIASVEQTVARIETRFPEARRIGEGVRELASRYQPVLMHGDVSYHNALVSGRDLALIDWEYARLDGFPMADAMDFVLYDLYRDIKDYRTAVRSLFGGGEGPHMKLLERYAAARGINPADIRPFFDLFVLAKLDLLAKINAPRVDHKAAELLAALGEISGGRA